jgi:hypothetical protein
LTLKYFRILEDWLIFPWRFSAGKCRHLLFYLAAIKSRMHCLAVEIARRTGNAGHRPHVPNPNGSGKNSILKSFQFLHPEYRFLNISLATFKEKPVRLF